MATIRRLWRMQYVTTQSEAIGLQYDGKQEGGLLDPQWQSNGALPVINIVGCPTHPNWISDTLM